MTTPVNDTPRFDPENFDAPYTFDQLERLIAQGTRTKLRVLCHTTEGEPNGEVTLVGVPRNLVGENDEYFWFHGDTDIPRLWFTTAFEHFIDVRDILGWSMA